MNKKILTTARLLFGGSFFIFGINGFLHIIPNPAMTADMVALLEAFAKTGYFFPMIKPAYHGRLPEQNITVYRLT